MATKCAINGRQWGAYDGRRHSVLQLQAAEWRMDETPHIPDHRALRSRPHIG